jgi:hypothetical protein
MLSLLYINTSTCFGLVYKPSSSSTIYNKTDNVSINSTWGAFTNHSCRGKAIRVTYLSAIVCARVRMCGYRGAWAYACTHWRTCRLAQPAYNAYKPYWDVICGPSGSITFCDIITLTARFSEKMLWIMKCVFWFSLQLLSKTFLILKSIQRDIVINAKTSSCKVPVILVGF